MYSKGLFLFSFLLLSFGLIAQGDSPQFEINSQTTFKDKEGNLLSFETFLEWTSGSSYEMTPVFEEDGSLKEIVVITSDIAEPIRSSNDFGTTEELIGRRPPEFEVTDLNGNFLTLSNFKDKVIVLKFWFRACMPCIKEMPELNRLVADYGEEVAFIGASLDSKEDCERFLQAKRFDYDIVPDALQFARSYNVPGYPTHVIINRQGKVEAVYKGVNNNIYGKLKSAIDRALSRTASDTPPAPEAVSSLDETDESDVEVFVTPQSIIKNKEGKLVPFSEFVALMNTARFELLPQKEEDGSSFLLMKEVVIE